MASEAQTVSICALAGLSGFVFGAYFQHEITLRNLICLVRTDPYAYNNRRKLYNVLSLFKGDIEDRLRLPMQQPLSRRIRDVLLMPLFSLCNYILIIKNPRTDGPDLVTLMKYGFPSSENIQVHKDYVVAYDARNSGAQWVCEHMTNNYKKLQRTQTTENLNLRFNDVFVLSNGSTRIGQAFKSKIWQKLEQYITELTEKYGSVYVYSGPVYLPVCKNGDWSLEYQVINWIPVPVPSHFFKVLIIDSQLSNCSPYMEGYIVPNVMATINTDLRRYLSDIEEIERYTGLKFINGLRHNILFQNENYIAESKSKLPSFNEVAKKMARINNAYVKEIS